MVRLVRSLVPALVPALVAAALLAACGAGSPGTPEPTAPSSSLTVSSPAFVDGGPIPTTYTCAAAGERPP